MGDESYTLMDINDKMSSEIYGDIICQLGEKHSDIVGLTADLAGSTKIGMYQKKFPNRFFNLGVAEQNLYGTAAGIARSGLTPFVSTFAAFTSMRAAEQVRTDICYPNLNVKMISTHGGTTVSTGGTTHHATEDIGIMRTFANLTIVVPGDGHEAGKAVIASYQHEGPIYIRLNRGVDKPIYDSMDYDFEIGKSVEIESGYDLTIIACGSPLVNARDAVQKLREVDGLHVRIVNMHTIKPIDKEAILSAIKETGHIVTLEDHNTVGGLGDAVASVVAESGMGCKFEKIGIPDEYVKMIGTPLEILEHYSMDVDGIYQKLCSILK